MLAQLVSVGLTASVKATDTKGVSSFNHFHNVMAIELLKVPALISEEPAWRRIGWTAWFGLAG